MKPETTTHQSVMIDEISADGTILACDPAQAIALGYDQASLIGTPVSTLYPLPSRRILEAHLSRSKPGPIPEELEIRDAQGNTHRVAAILDIISPADGPQTARVLKWFQAGFITNTRQLSEDKEILEDIVAASSDPGWCIQFIEPVDLSAPEQEIVRQVFCNRRRWRFCNQAMARFYKLPEGVNINDRPVDEIFPQSLENEDFVRQLIRSDFDVDGAASLDTRYDGVQLVVENDVRGLIRKNFLYRMWGTVRDVSKHHRIAEELREQIADLEAIISAVPDALILLDPSGRIIHANAIALRMFGLDTTQIEGCSYDRLIGENANSSALWLGIRDTATGDLRKPIATRLRSMSGSVPVDVNARRFGMNGVDCLAVTLRAQPISGTPPEVPAPQPDITK
ncbi:MAG: hypothetical protein CL812_09005 [Confluentimicrobium sp.]|nr:hypothetical protein [Actibacterium sp.]